MRLVDPDSANSGTVGCTIRAWKLDHNGYFAYGSLVRAVHDTEHIF